MALNFKKSREPEPTVDIGSSVDVAEPETAGRRTTAKKGRPTPKRSQARAARPAQGTFGPAATTKEARRRERDLRRRETAEARTAMRTGDISRMPARERAPERVLARDIVDSRRNFGPVFLLMIILFYVASFIPNPGAHQVILYVMLAGMCGIVADSWYVSQKVARAVREQYPGSRVPVKMYAVQRAIAPRRMRTPRARVSPRDKEA